MNQELNTTIKPVLKEYLTVKDASEYMGVPVSRLKQWSQAKVIPSYRLASLLMFKISDLDAMIKPI